MKCELVRDDCECISPTPDEEQTTVIEVMRNGKIVKRRMWKRGAIIDDPQAFRLVQNGVAIPSDDECKKAADMSDQDIKAAIHAAERLSKGIATEDYGLFDRGVIVGYLPDGSYAPGPNYHELEEKGTEEKNDGEELFDEE